MIFDCVRGQVQLCRDRFGRRAAQYQQRDLGFPSREPQRAKDQRRIATGVGRFNDHGNLVIGGAMQRSPVDQQPAAALSPYP